MTDASGIPQPTSAGAGIDSTGATSGPRPATAHDEPASRTAHDPAPLDDVVVREIAEAVHRAESAVVHEEFVRKAAAPYYQSDTDWVAVESRMHHRQHETVRTKAQELDVKAAAYYRTNPSAIAECTAHCLDKWPELNDVAYSRPGDDDLYPKDEDYFAQRARAEADAAVADGLVADGLAAAGHSDGLPVAGPGEFDTVPSELSGEPLWTDSVSGPRRYTVEENANGGFNVLSPGGEVVATYPWTSRGGQEHAEMLAAADCDSRNGEWEVAGQRTGQAGEVLIEATLEPRLVLQIKASALRADEAARGPEAVRAYEATLRAELGPDFHRTQHYQINERAHEAWHQAIRDNCAKLGVGAGAYFHSDPDEVDNCGVTCATAWPEVTTVACEGHPYDDNLTLHTCIEPDGLAADEPKASQREMTDRQPDANEDEWVRSILAGEEPPVSDLDCGLRSRY